MTPEQLERNQISLRDYLAGQAMAGLLARDHPFNNLAEDAYRLADQMLEAKEEWYP